jgi:hypothetical protein
MLLIIKTYFKFFLLSNVLIYYIISVIVRDLVILTMVLSRSLLATVLQRQWQVGIKKEMS